MTHEEYVNFVHLIYYGGPFDATPFVWAKEVLLTQFKEVYDAVASFDNFADLMMYLSETYFEVLV